MPSRNTYRLTWVSLTLDVGSLFTAAPAKRPTAPYLGRGAGRLRGATPHLRSGAAAERSYPMSKAAARALEGQEELLHIQKKY